MLLSGVNGVHYDFCEIPPATISGYVFQDGPPIPLVNPGDAAERARRCATAS